MRAFDDIGNTLADIVGAKNRVVEVIGMHRFLAAPVRRSKENQNVKVGESLRDSHRIQNVSLPAFLARLRWPELKNQLGFYPRLGETRPHPSYCKLPTGRWPSQAKRIGAKKLLPPPLPTGSRPLDTRFGQPVRPLLKKIPKTAKSGEKSAKSVQMLGGRLAEIFASRSPSRAEILRIKQDPWVSARLGDRLLDSVELV